MTRRDPLPTILGDPFTVQQALDAGLTLSRLRASDEGEIHSVSTRVFGDDIERRERFQDAGWRHIRVVKGHLAKPHRLVDRVGFALTERRNAR